MYWSIVTYSSHFEWSQNNTCYPSQLNLEAWHRFNGPGVVHVRLGAVLDKFPSKSMSIKPLDQLVPAWFLHILGKHLGLQSRVGSVSGRQGNTIFRPEFESGDLSTPGQATQRFSGANMSHPSRCKPTWLSVLYTCACGTPNSGLECSPKKGSKVPMWTWKVIVDILQPSAQAPQVWQSREHCLNLADQAGTGMPDMDRWINLLMFIGFKWCQMTITNSSSPTPLRPPKQSEQLGLQAKTHGSTPPANLGCCNADTAIVLHRRTQRLQVRPCSGIFAGKLRHPKHSMYRICIYINMPAVSPRNQAHITYMECLGMVLGCLSLAEGVSTGQFRHI